MSEYTDKKQLLDELLRFVEAKGVTAIMLYSWAQARDLSMNLLQERSEMGKEVEELRKQGRTVEANEMAEYAKSYSLREELEAVCDAEHDPARDTVNFLHEELREAFAAMYPDEPGVPRA